MPANPIPVRRVLLLAAPPGTTPVTGDLRRAMAASYYRGAGPNGTRATRITPGNGAPRVTAGQWQPQLMSHGRPTVMAAGATRYGPGLAGLGMITFPRPMPADSATVQITMDRADLRDGTWSAGQHSSLANRPLTSVTASPPDPTLSVNQAGRSFTTASEATSGSRTFTVIMGPSSAAPPAPTAPVENADAALLVTTATNTVRSFVEALYNGQIDPASAAPGAADTLARPTGVSDATWAAYTFQRDRIAGARTAGQMAWAVLHPATTPQTTPGSTTTTQTPAPTNPSGVSAGVAPSPISTPGAGYDIYGSDGGEQVVGVSPQGGTTIVRRGGAAQQTPAPAQAPQKSKAGLVVGLAVLAGIGVYAMRGRGGHHATHASQTG